MVVNLLIVVFTLSTRTLTTFSVDEAWLPKYVNLSNDFRGLPFNEA